MLLVHQFHSQLSFEKYEEVFDFMLSRGATLHPVCFFLLIFEKSFNSEIITFPLPGIPSLPNCN